MDSDDEDIDRFSSLSEESVTLTKKEDVRFNFTRQHPLELRRWPIFNLLELSFIEQIYMVMIFGEDGNSAIIATRDNMVYGLGTNDNGRLGFQDTDNDIPYRTLYPEKIQILSGKYIKKFLHCSKMCNAALMGNGQVNFWGTSIFHAYKTPFKLDGLNEKVIINIACSARYFLFLDENGTVYVWGEHSYVAREKASHITNDYIYIRKSFEIISEALNGKKVVHIACGSNFSVVITDENKLYSWGDNEYGQLGDVEYALHKNDSYCTFSYTPLEIITLSNKDIVKVVCGKAHTLALSKDGKLFTWGRNNYGQLGVEKKNFRRLNLLPMKTILDIAAVYTSDISVALAEDECVYIWGCCFNMKITTPIVTTFSTIYDVFTNNVPHMVYIYDRVIAHESKHSKRIEMDTMWKSLETAFDDPTTSDLVVNVENKPIYVHKIILMKRSEYFKNLLHNEYMEEEKNLRVNIQHFEFSYVVYKAFLEYLYTEMIKLSTVENILELLTLANTFGERQLKYQCSKLIKSGFTTSNVISIYKFAIQNNMKRVEGYCFQFILKHTTAVVLSESFINLNSDIQLRLMRNIAEAKAFKNFMRYIETKRIDFDHNSS